MTELRPGDIVRLDGPPLHSSRVVPMLERMPKLGEMGVVLTVSSKYSHCGGPTGTVLADWAWVDFPLLGQYCMFPQFLTVMGHVEGEL